MGFVYRLNSVIPTGANHRDSGDLRSGEPALSEVEGDLVFEWSSFRHYATGCDGPVEILSEWTARKRERAEARLCPAVKLPLSSQERA